MTYVRVPITDETAPDEGDFDQLVALLTMAILLTVAILARAVLTNRATLASG